MSKRVIPIESGSDDKINLEINGDIVTIERSYRDCYGDNYTSDVWLSKKQLAQIASVVEGLGDKS